MNQRKILMFTIPFASISAICLGQKIGYWLIKQINKGQ